MSEKIAYTLTNEELENIVEGYVNLPQNKSVKEDFLSRVCSEIEDIVKGYSTTEKVISDILDTERVEYAEKIVEDRAVEIEDSEFDTLVSEYESDGVTYFTGASVADLNVEDIYSSVTPKYVDCAYGGLVNLEDVLNGKLENGQEINVFKNSDDDRLLLVIY